MLNDLPKRQREAFELYYGEGHSQEVGAEYMGVSRQAFGSLLSKAKRRLAAMGLPVHEENFKGGRKVQVVPSIYDLDI